MSSFLLAHDLGTTGNKATLYDEQGNLQASQTHEYGTNYPRSNWVEQDPEDWWESVIQTTRELLDQSTVEPDAIEAICFSGQMMGCLPVDQDGAPLRSALIWADQRGVEEADRLRDSLGMQRVYDITGHRISANYSAAKVMWIRNHQPDLFEDTHKILQAKDFIIHKLTGQFVTDYSDASGTNLFDLENKEWSEDILNAAQIPRDKLPEARPSTEVVGELTPSAAQQTGLEAGTPVVLGGGDGSCAATGAGVVKPNRAYNYLGSSSWIALSTSEPIYDPELRTFNWAHLNPDLYSPCGTMQSAGGSLEWARETLFNAEAQAAELAEEDIYRLINREVEDSPPGANGLLFLPYLIGERSPHWDPKARGAFVGLTRTHEKKDLIRAVMEGVCFNLRIIMEAFERQGARFDHVRVIGGGAESPPWRQIMADVYERTVLVPEYLRQATSLGAAVAGGVGVGLFEDFGIIDEFNPIRDRREPDENHKKRYRERFELFQQSYRNLRDVFHRLAERS